MEIIPINKQQNSAHEIHLPPGFRFHPSDEELVSHYLRNKLLSISLPAKIIADVDLCKYDPWELPSKALFGEEEWYFFSPRDRKYPKGNRPNRAAGTGYWKATGTDKNVLSSCGTKSVGLKKALVFYIGRPPKGIKTDWIMTEYRSVDAMISWTSSTFKRKGSMRLDDWVLCRIRNKSSNDAKNLCLSENPNDGPRRYFDNLDDINVQACPKPIVDCNFYMDFPMLPPFFATSQHPLPFNMETPSVISTTTSIPSLNDTPKSRENGSETGFQFSPASVSQESLLSSLQPNKKITKNLDYNHKLSISSSPETQWFWDFDDHPTKSQSFVNVDHDWNHDSNFQYDHEAVQTVNWDIL